MMKSEIGEDLIPHEKAHAARIDDDGIVREIIVIPYCDDDDAKVTEYCNGIGLAGTWLDCSYLGARRGKYPGMGDRYDADLDEFVSPKSPEPDEIE
jgi:hypothetical protein